MENLQNYIDKLNKLNFKEMYEGDFFLTWEKTDDELEAVFTIADALRYMRENNISTKIFESGLGRVLLRLFFTAAAALADGNAVEIHLHREDLGVIGALGADELVAQHLAALPLHQLLEGGLVIAAG